MRGSSRAVLGLALFIPLILVAGVLSIDGWNPLSAGNSCTSLPVPHQAPVDLIPVVNLITSNAEFTQAAQGKQLYFSNASIEVDGTDHPYTADNPYLREVGNITGQVNLVAEKPGTSLLILMVPMLSAPSDSVHAVLVKVTPPLVMTFSGVLFSCSEQASTYNPFPQPTYQPVLYHDSNLGFACPPPRPVPSNISSIITSIENNRWFLQVEDGQTFQFVSGHAYNQTGMYNNQTEYMTFLEATFSYAMPSSSNPNNNGSYIYVRALLPFNGALTRPWSLTISRFDGQFVLNPELSSCRGIWMS